MKKGDKSLVELKYFVNLKPIILLTPFLSPV